MILEILIGVAAIGAIAFVIKKTNAKEVISNDVNTIKTDVTNTVDNAKTAINNDVNTVEADVTNTVTTVKTEVIDSVKKA